jgi:hypothetical protein
MLFFIRLTRKLLSCTWVPLNIMIRVWRHTTHFLVGAACLKFSRSQGVHDKDKARVFTPLLHNQQTNKSVSQSRIKRSKLLTPYSFIINKANREKSLILLTSTIVKMLYFHLKARNNTIRRTLHTIQTLLIQCSCLQRQSKS